MLRQYSGNRACTLQTAVSWARRPPSRPPPPPPDCICTLPGDLASPEPALPKSKVRGQSAPECGLGSGRGLGTRVRGSYFLRPGDQGGRSVGEEEGTQAGGGALGGILGRNYWVTRDHSAQRSLGIGRDSGSRRNKQEAIRGEGLGAGATWRGAGNTRDSERSHWKRGALRGRGAPGE